MISLQGKLLRALPLLSHSRPWAQRGICWFPVAFPAGQVPSWSFSVPHLFSHSTEAFPGASAVVRHSRRDGAPAARPFISPPCPRERSETAPIRSVMQRAFSYANVFSAPLAQPPVFFQLLFWKSSTSCGSATRVPGAVWSPPNLSSPGRLKLAPGPCRSYPSLAASPPCPSDTTPALGVSRCQRHRLVSSPCREQGHGGAAVSPRPVHGISCQPVGGTW